MLHALINIGEGDQVNCVEAALANKAWRLSVRGVFTWMVTNQDQSWGRQKWLCSGSICEKNKRSKFTKWVVFFYKSSPNVAF